VQKKIFFQLSQAAAVEAAVAVAVAAAVVVHNEDCPIQRIYYGEKNSKSPTRTAAHRVGL